MGHYDVMPYDPPYTGWRMFSALAGRWENSAGVTVSADYHLTGPYVSNLGELVPRITPSHHGLWEGSTATAINCGFGCAVSPGPCGTCGVYLMERPEFLLTLHDRRVERMQEIGPIEGITNVLVVGQVEVHGVMCTVPRKFGNSFGLPEQRAESVTIRSLFVPDGEERLVEPLSARYGAPVRVGITLENLTKQEAP